MLSLFPATVQAQLTHRDAGATSAVSGVQGPCRRGQACGRPV